VVRLTQDIKYDSNLTNQASGKLESVSYTGAVLSKTGFFVKYEKVFRNWIAVTPELSGDITIHANRKDPTIYTNDATNLTFAMRGRLDHTLKQKPAAGLIEYEFYHNTQDYKKVHSQDFKVLWHNFILGERFEFFKTGSTTAKISYKFSRNASPTSDYVAPKVSVAQNFSIASYILNSNLSWERQVARDMANDQTAYGLNNTFGVPKLFWNTNVDLSLNFTFTDTMYQRSTRGIEQTYAPGVTFTKELSKLFNGTLSYTYTNNVSKDKQSYDYSKSVFGLGVQATF
jgi:hypothetical protein